MSERCYHYAREHSGYCQEFLDKFDMGEHSNSVKNIVYFERKIGGKIMRTVINPMSKKSTGALSTIGVSDCAFIIYSYHEFCNVLAAHKGTHASQNYSDPSVFGGKIIKVDFRDHITDYTEKGVKRNIEAYLNQIDHHTFSKCSINFRKEIHRNLDTHQRIMKYINQLPY